ncbi:hypothetical protein ROLI_028870 [Roseobacter fucihabitans]|uniref:Replication protein A C-terminal domain-containing protein n=1 Tax=Roseobacter fucihabitans TaxID=1537242 RepID=A0ABZ2BUT5_9RHOB|nr:hypothetical protein [Roseobacter litoralis]MBC6964805.1 hypothetical protein [Roseobacter litoralis]
MSVIDEIKELEAKKQKLLSAAKAEALKAAQKAIGDLKALGFEYHLAEGAKPKLPRTPRKPASKPRRGDTREKVQQLITDADSGLMRKEIIAALNATDKPAQQSISNALAALKKAKVITSEGRVYKLV